MADTTPRLTGPHATALLLAVHSVRERLDGEIPDIRHLTQTLAAAAGVPALAAPWRPDMPLPDGDVIRAVRSGLTESRVLYIHHLQQDGEVRRLHVEPYHVRLEGGFWYLIGRLADEGTERVLRLDKVVSAAAEDVFKPRPVDLDRYLGGIFVPADPGAVALVRFGPRSAVYAQERWGMGTELPDGSVEVEIPFQREHFFVRSLAEFGRDYEVLTPLSLREGIRARAQATLAKYATGGDE
ncbi:MAG: WYL domain-containing protein [Coriobacteriia bacterium]|nr:WYL domain-containing protein [Coriobacteriia bacterium]